jgi:hypothetical protein
MLGTLSGYLFPGFFFKTPTRQPASKIQSFYLQHSEADIPSTILYTRTADQYHERPRIGAIYISMMVKSTQDS